MQVLENVRPNKVKNTLQVLKRDGRKVKYNRNRIIRAIERAEKDATGSKTDLGVIIAERVERALMSRYEAQTIDIPTIQNLVERELMKSSAKDVARNYIEFRSLRDAEREQDTDINVRLRKLQEKDKTVVNENANKDSSTYATQRDLTAGIVSKAEGLKMLPPHVANAHLRGDIHFHDLDYSPYASYTNCCLPDFKNMLEQGFTMGNTEIGSPQSIQTATAITAQILSAVASSQFGGVSFDRIDEVLAPYAELNYQKHLVDAKELTDNLISQQEFATRKTIKDIYDAMQSLEYEINTLYTANGQTPFSSIGFGLGTSLWAREIQKAIFQVRMDGLGVSKRTAIFPKLIFIIKDGVNHKETDCNYDIKRIALKCSTLRMYPDVISYDKMVELTGSCRTPMGCRSHLSTWRDATGQEVNAGRMNMGVVTLNLPRVAIESEGDMSVFWTLLAERMQVVHDALEYRMNRVLEALPENAPILYKHGAFGARLADGESVKPLFLNKRATISLGFIGLYEVGVMLFGEDWQQDHSYNKDTKEFLLEVIQYLHKCAEEWTEEWDVKCSVYSTPSESLADRFCRMDKEKFGIIVNVTDKGWYTNSFHYFVEKKPTPFEKIDYEKDFLPYTPGGNIVYAEYPKLTHNLDALEAVWDYAHSRVGYLGTNTPIDHCFDCGYQGEFIPTTESYECPQCGNNDPAKADVTRRTCGYLGQPLARPNVEGRKKEIDARVKHM